MKALVCHSFGGPEELRLEEVETPVGGPGKLLVDVAASGLNYADLVVIRGQYQGQKQPPIIPGFEVYGTVAEVGSAAGDFRAGDRVIGQVWDGGFGQRVAMDASTTIRLPFDMPAADAAALYANYGTAYSAMVQRGGGHSSETLLVLGAAGGVGLAAVQLGRALGMTVLADCRGAIKQDLARAEGAHHIVDHSAADFADRVKRITSGRGCDLVLDMIGADATKAALRVIARMGRLVVIGFAGGTPHLIPANHLLVKNCAVIGHWWGDLNTRDRSGLVDVFDALFAMYGTGAIRPYIDQIVSPQDVPSALARYERREVLGKMVCMWDR